MVTIVDYGAGNLTSVRLAFEHLGVAAGITADPAVIRAARRVVFPGVGAAGAAMRNLDARGLIPVLRDVVLRGTPFLGMCLGAQIVLDFSEEDGGVECLGLLEGSAVRFRPRSAAVKVPHMGWNAVHCARAHPVFCGIDDGSEFYFVHSYYPAPVDAAAVTLGYSEYAGVRFCAALARDNLVATQFHPEKSGRVGLRLLENFSHWEGAC